MSRPRGSSPKYLAVGQTIMGFGAVLTLYTTGTLLLYARRPNQTRSRGTVWSQL